MSSGTSYNGWPANSDPNAIGIDKNWGAKVGAPPFGSGGYASGMKSGDVSTVFVYLVNRLHKEVEPMMKEGNNLGYGCWGYSYRANVNNPSTLSCHASGTAIDYNAPKHPNGTSTGPNGGGGWTGAQYNKIQAILKEIGVISWLTGNDPMHFEIKGSAQQVAAAAARLGGSTGGGDDDDMDAQTFKQYMNDWYNNEPVVKLNNGEQTTMKQFNQNIDQRTWTAEQAAKKTLGET